MSNDLISRKALMVAINTDFYEHFTAHHDSDQTALIDMVMQDIEEIPTAYDADAVIEKLEKLKESAWDTWNAIDSEQDFGEAIAYKNAIDIVRNGGMKG